MPISPEVLVKYGVLRREGRIGRVWVSTESQTVGLAPINAPKLYEYRHKVEMSDMAFVELIEKEWLNRPLELFK